MAYCHLVQLNFFSTSHAFCAFHTCLKDTISGITSKGFAMFMELILVFFQKICIVTPCVQSFHSREKRSNQWEWNNSEMTLFKFKIPTLACIGESFGLENRCWKITVKVKQNTNRQIIEHLLLQSWMLPSLLLRSNFGKKNRSYGARNIFWLLLMLKNGQLLKNAQWLGMSAQALRNDFVERFAAKIIQCTSMLPKQIFQRHVRLLCDLQIGHISTYRDLSFCWQYKSP